MMKMKITKKTKLGELLKENPEVAMVLMDAGMGCVGCPMAQMETIEQGCLAHGMNQKDIEELVEKLNKKKKEK